MRLIAHNDGRALRGNERQLLLLAGGLARRGHDVLVSCREGAPLAVELERRGLAATAVRPRGDLALGSARAFRRLIDERRPDAVLLTSWKRLFVGALAARSAARIVARLGIVRRMPTRGWSATKLRRALERVDVLVVNSEAVRDAWIESAPWFAADRLRVVRNAVVREPGDAEVLRRALGLGTEVQLVAVVAALEPRKGVDRVLRALAALPEEVHAVVAGDGPEASTLRSLAQSLALDGRVHWLGERSDVAHVLAASGAFVLPTRRDSIPNALLEAMAAGVPVVTSPGNGAEEAIGERDGRPAAGWIAAPDDPAALAAAVSEALGLDASDTPTARRAEALWRAEHWFGVDRMVAEYERVLFAGG